MLANNARGAFTYTPSTNLLQGLKVALDMLDAEGMDHVFARHDRAAEATRRAVKHWGLEILCLDRPAIRPASPPFWCQRAFQQTACAPIS